MKKNDQKEIERVREIWQNESRRVLDFFDEIRSEMQNSLNDEIKNTDGYVYEEDGLIKGFMLMENSYINELFVDSHCQGKGIGTNLSDLAKHRSMFLYTHVYVRNFKAVNWYFGRGFVVAKTHEHEDPKRLKYKMVWSKSLAPADPG